jgi:hypothetical protein
MDTLLLNGACCPNQVSHETVGRRKFAFYWSGIVALAAGVRVLA